ncbi:hypothetical protein ENH_00049300, partial [Eimeria necatrix]
MGFSWEDAQAVLAAAADPEKLEEIAQRLSTEEEKEYSKSLIALEKEEVLLKPNPRRWVVLPIVHHEVWNMYKKAEASFWTTEEIDMSADLADWATLDSNEQHFIKHVLAFFAA